MAFPLGLAVLGGAALGSAGEYFGARETANAARDVAAQQVSSAREQMAFQERMSNSAYQRATTDMRAAGLNPMLAIDQGGASSPAGASVGSLPVPESAFSSLGGIFNSAKESARVLQELSESDSRIKLNSDLADKARADAGLSQTSSKRMGYEASISDLKKQAIEKVLSTARDIFSMPRSILNSTPGEDPGYSLDWMQQSIP